MHYRQSPGNVLTEYGLLIGLVAVASVASLNLLGNSVSGVFGKVDNGLGNDYVSSILGGGNGAQVGNLTAGGASPKTAAGAPSLNSNVDTSAYQFKPADYSSSGTNATSSNGSSKVQAVQQSLSIGQQFAKMAEAAAGSDETYITWLKSASMHSFILAGAEASYSQKDFPELAVVTKGTAQYNTTSSSTTVKELNPAAAIYSIYGNAYQLTNLKNQITTNQIKATPEQKAQALAMMNSQLADLESGYGDVIQKYILPGYTNVNLDAMRRDFGAAADNMAWTDGDNVEDYSARIQANAPTALSSGAVDNTPAIKASLQTGITSSTKATTLSKDGH